MFYTKDLGITATKAELVALLQFTRNDVDTLSGVGFRVEDGKLLAQATNGASAVYHHGEALDGHGGKYDGNHEWQLGSEGLSRIAKSMTGKDEVVLSVNRDGRLTVALVREEADGDPKIKIDLDGHVSEQLSINLTNVAPARPVASANTIGRMGLAPSLLAPIAKVARACGGGASRWTFPPDDKSPVYIEIDGGGRLADDLDVAAWVVVVMPLRLDGETDEPSPYRAEAERILAEQATRGAAAQ